MGTTDFNADAKAILLYLKAWPHTFISGREIARKAGGKKRYAENRFWAVPVLAKMVEEGSLESDQNGHFCLKEKGGKSKDKAKRFISPQIIKILKNSGQSLEAINIDEYDDDPLAPYPKYLIVKEKPGSQPVFKPASD